MRRILSRMAACQYHEGLAQCNLTKPRNRRSAPLRLGVLLDDLELHAPVGGAPFGSLIGRHRPLRAKAFRLQAVGRDPLVRQIFNDRSSAALTEVLVVGRSA